MRGDIIQDTHGHFYRDNADGTCSDLSGPPGLVPTLNIKSPVVLVRNGQATGAGDKLAARVAVVMARRYA